MKNPPEYIYLINLLLKKRGDVDGYYSDIKFDINELGPELIEDKKKLEEMLSHFKRDKITVKFGRETVIKDFNINENVVTITGSSTKKLEQYREEIIDNKIDLSIKPISSLRLLPDTKWENITIKFIDGHDVDIFIKNQEPIKSTYSEMDFQDKRKRCPNKQWALLKILAHEGGKISWESQNANPKIKKQKQLLSSQLKKYFSLNEDPFYPYKAIRKNSCYQVRFELIPEPGSLNINRDKVKRNKHEYNEEIEDEFGIEEGYNDSIAIKKSSKKNNILICSKNNLTR
ncbi:MAG: hypothetical protein Q8O59_01765 [bacterium]|nr:hypothetical protein [bacterium]